MQPAAEILAKHRMYVKRAKEGGAKFTKYSCPECLTVIETLQAPKGQDWDTVALCPHCLKLHVKLTHGDSAEGVKHP